MNKNIIKIISGLLLCSFLTYTTPIFAFTKEESVYSKMNASGEVYKTIVSTHLKNEDQENILDDISDLINIENINGDETFTQDGENISWAANGGDIYYQGETKKELPIKCNIKYELNGEEISVKDLAGKSGKVKITIQYENTDEHRVSVNGKMVSLYTPFTVICGTMFENTQNKNIEISSGKVVNDGTKTIVMGVAMPGMQKSLNISKNTLEIPESIEITLDTNKYEQSNIITFVTPKIFKEKISFNKLNNLYAKVNEIEEASKKIEDGANTLKDGMKTLNSGTTQLNEKYVEFDNGIESAFKGSKQLSAGTVQINSGVGELQAGASQLNSGVTQINQSLSGVNMNQVGGQLFNGIGDLQTGATTLSNGISSYVAGTETLANGVNSYVAGSESIANGVKALDSNLQAMIANCDAAISNGIDVQKNTIIKNTLQGILNDSSYASLQAGATQLTTADASGLTVGKKLQAGAAQLINTDEAGLTAGGKLEYGATQLNEGIDTLNNKATSAIGGLGTKISDLKNNMAKVQIGTEGLNAGIEQIKKGTEQAAVGSESLTNGLDVLNSSSKQVRTALNQLVDGSTKLVDGTVQLSEGITEFNTQAIEKICNYVNSNVKDIASRAEKLQELSEEYVNFTKATDNTAKEVKFILITDSIKVKADEEDN